MRIPKHAREELDAYLDGKPWPLRGAPLPQYVRDMLKTGDSAPDFPIGSASLYALLEGQHVAVYFFPKAFTPG